MMLVLPDSEHKVSAESILSVVEGLEMTTAAVVPSTASVIPNVRLCENYVHGSTALTTNGITSFEIRHLSRSP